MAKKIGPEMKALTLEQAVAEFGASAKSKLDSATIKGQPEDQLRAPFERLLSRLAVLAGFPAERVVAVGESALSHLKLRPDYAVTVHGALAGFVELKAPGKGAHPSQFKDPHDKAQWAKLASLPNLIYCDGNSFSLWRNGEICGEVVRLEGDIATSGDEMLPGNGLLPMFELFLRWQPSAPSSARELADVSARLCRLLRDEVSEALGRDVKVLTSLANDWRKVLFPNATDQQFADGYAQAVTFGLLMARANGIAIGADLHKVADALKDNASLIGSALALLTDNKDARQELKTALETLCRVLDAVDWDKISKRKPDAWLYFYEDFLETYDNRLRKATGSYYTPPQVVTAMVSLVDEALQGPGFNLTQGLADESVVVADPAAGTGTYLLGVLRHVAQRVSAGAGPGSVPGAVETVLRRLMAFELQLGPFAVAQLRLMAEVRALTDAPPRESLKMYVTDTLGNPNDDGGDLLTSVSEFSQQRLAANRVKREQPITVVIGNPPYKDKAKGLGGWIEGAGSRRRGHSPLDDWQPPTSWKLGNHTKHLRNLYVYFWRWAARKVFDDLPGQQPGGASGIVAFITAAGFLDGPGFQRMRQSLRQRCSEIWVIDCTPEGHQPEVSSRIFEGVQQPLCIVLASRWRGAGDSVKPLARVRWRALPIGHRREKFEALAQLRLNDQGWQEGQAGERDPFFPAAVGPWANHVGVESLFAYDGSGVMPGRTWVIASDAVSLTHRWQAIQAAADADKEKLFHPHMHGGKLGDKHANKVPESPLPGMPERLVSVTRDTGAPLAPVRYGFRSFDRQWILPDSRLINRANPTLWRGRSDKQVFLTLPQDQSPTAGPALTFSAFIPDLHHYNGRGGRTIPLWSDNPATASNVLAPVIQNVKERLGQPVTGEALFAYIAAVAAHPGYTRRFLADLAQPGLRIPLTSDAALFAQAVELGQRVIWLHTFGERFVDAAAQRPAGAPRLPEARRPRVPAGGAISHLPQSMPDTLAYDPSSLRLNVGDGYIEPVPKAVWDYEVSGKQVLVQWFSYRRKTRSRPQMGDRRPPSPLSNIQPDHWLHEYTTELLDVLNVLGLLVDLEPQAQDLLDRICSAPLIGQSMLEEAGVFFPQGHIPAGAVEPVGSESTGSESVD